MATLGEVVEQVIELTGYADKRNATRAQINLSIRRIAGTGNYPNNLLEQKFDGPFQDAVNTFPVIERFQAVGYVRAIGAELGTTGVRSTLIDRLEAINPADIIDSRRSFGHYISGENIIIKARATPETILIGWYQYPSNLSSDSETNWLLDRFEPIVIDMTATYLLSVAGDNAAADRLQRFTSAFLTTEVRSALNPNELGA